ncbi:MAG: glycosyltransferase family 2 protein [Candidatus Aminicenantes bacterium]|nr:glycosyltransferase family 2 protein [Candidatus Aminicenantes bacterium]
MEQLEKEWVTVHLLIYNHKNDLQSCIESVLKQDYKPLELIVSDNGSSDGSAEFVERHYPHLTLIKNPENLGYSRGHNRIIDRCRGTYFMPLNPDTVLSENYIQELVKAMKVDRVVGMVTGKLYRNENRVIDSTGIFFTPTLRHLDRGSNRRDEGQFEHLEYVFGVSGAAPLFKKDMLADVKIMDEYFDNDFFSYREDADLAWRAQLMGWRAVYTPSAVAYHQRRVLPCNRKTTPEEINLHSVKNRFLMRIKNLTWGVGLKTFFFFSLRDMMILGYILLMERASLKAFSLAIRHLPRTIEKRKQIMKKKAVPDGYLSKWFGWKPRSERISVPAGGEQKTP